MKTVTNWNQVRFWKKLSLRIEIDLWKSLDCSIIRLVTTWETFIIYVDIDS